MLDDDIKQLIKDPSNKTALQNNFRRLRTSSKKWLLSFDVQNRAAIHLRLTPCEYCKLVRVLIYLSTKTSSVKSTALTSDLVLNMHTCVATMARKGQNIFRESETWYYKSRKKS
uniref:Uncharacterized protein n=1 Tax=Schistocephalus solidus TaxID=70667 RepID=A0A0V0J940_SCHSO